MVLHCSGKTPKLYLIHLPSLFENKILARCYYFVKGRKKVVKFTQIWLILRDYESVFISLLFSVGTFKYRIG